MFAQSWRAFSAFEGSWATREEQLAARAEHGDDGDDDGGGNGEARTHAERLVGMQSNDAAAYYILCMIYYMSYI